MNNLNHFVTKFYFIIKWLSGGGTLLAYLALLHKLFAYDSQSIIRAKTLVNEQANIIRNNLNLLSKN